MTRKYLLGLLLALAVLALLATQAATPLLDWYGQWRGAAPTSIETTDTAGSSNSKSPASVTSDVTAGRTNTTGGLSARDLLDATSLGPDNAETRLVGIYALIEQGDFHAALRKAQGLVQDHPNFQLAQLVYADLLRLRYRPDAPLSDTDHAQLLNLRAESRKRLDALRNRPLPGTIPHQFVALSPASRHAIAIDASHSRLYLFENQVSPQADRQTPPNLKLVADFFISVGKSGIDKKLEGDGRTPLGNYYITSTKDRKSLPAFYGAGALPINYPNAFDNRQGRTGSGIWLHGTPPDQFVRAPLASDGCVVVSNPDMQRLLDTVAPRTTPVVIAEQLQWVAGQTLEADRVAFESVLTQWQEARSKLTAAELVQTFGPTTTRASGNGQGPQQPDLAVAPHVRLGITNVSLLQSRFPEANMVATFDETVDGAVTPVTRRQYWLKTGERWQMLQDTVIAGVPSAALKRPPPQRETQLASADQAKTAVAPPEAATKPTDRKPAKPAEAAGSAAEQARVRQALQSWTRAWSQKNMQAYFGAYDRTFDPPGGLSRKAWEKDRTDRIVYKSKIRVELDNVHIKVSGDTATATFIQRYQADQLNVSGRKTLRLVKRGNDWRIAQESIGG
ncbi:MAG TPA: L,D-transpeptidase family protein [Burkholderiaceae bacterium]|nr:L,D-transpeptidase family protein [Burkholderiaceae bacterium]